MTMEEKLGEEKDGREGERERESDVREREREREREYFLECAPTSVIHYRQPQKGEN